MLSARFILWMVIAGFILFGTGTASAQSYPTRPIRLVTYPPGGGTDFGARLISQGLTTISGWRVIVDNRPGGVIQGEILAAAPPDGYTLLYGGTTLWLLPFTETNVPYDSVKDFAPVTMTAIAPNILVVHPSLPVKSVKQLIALAKTKPGALNWASGPNGTPNMLAAELLNRMAAINIVRVNYPGVGPAIIALLGGQVQVSFASTPSAMTFVKSGRLRALAVTTAQPSELAPGLPTVAAGLPGFEVVSTYGVLAPAKTPVATINILNHEIIRTLNRPDLKEKFLGAGTETVSSSPEQFAARIKSEMATYGKIIKDAGIHE